MASCLVFLWCGGRHPGSVFKIKPVSLQPSSSCGTINKFLYSSLLRLSYLVVPALSFLQDFCADEVR